MDLELPRLYFYKTIERSILLWPICIAQIKRKLHKEEKPEENNKCSVEKKNQIGKKNQITHIVYNFKRIEKAEYVRIMTWIDIKWIIWTQFWLRFGIETIEHFA